MERNGIKQARNQNDLVLPAINEGALRPLQAVKAELELTSGTIADLINNAFAPTENTLIEIAKVVGDREIDVNVDQQLQIVEGKDQKSYIIVKHGRLSIDRGNGWR
jgi:hypothetical protein